MRHLDHGHPPAGGSDVARLPHSALARLLLLVRHRRRRGAGVRVCASASEIVVEQDPGSRGQHFLSGRISFSVSTVRSNLSAVARPTNTMRCRFSTPPPLMFALLSMSSFRSPARPLQPDAFALPSMANPESPGRRILAFTTSRDLPLPIAMNWALPVPESFFRRSIRPAQAPAR